MTIQTHHRFWNALLVVQVVFVVVMLFWFQIEASDSIRQQLRPTNATPQANAGSDIAVNEQDGAVVLNGASSQDSDGDSLSFFWSELSDEADACSLRLATLAQPTVSIDNTLQSYSCVFQLSVSDGLKESDPDTMTVHVQADNDGPSFTSLDKVSAQEGEQLYWEIWLTDPEEQAGAIQIDDINNDFQTADIDLHELFSDLTGGHAALTWTPSFQQSGTYVVEVSGTDGEFTTSQQLNITVNDVNLPPQYVGGEQQLLVNTGKSQSTGVNLRTLFEDPDEDQLSFTVQESSSISFTIEAGAVFVTSSEAEVGVHEVRFLATDDQGQVAVSSQMEVVVVEGELSSVASLKGTKRGKGRVQLLDSSGTVIETFVAFAMGGVRPRLVDIGNETLILAVKNAAGKQIGLFDLSGEVVRKGDLSERAQWKPLFSLNVDEDSSTTEMLLLGKRDDNVVLNIMQIQSDFSFQEFASTTLKNFAMDQVSIYYASGTVRGVNEKGEEVFTWKLKE